MATLLLQVAGAALGTALGGPVGGAIGQALGGLAGASLDQAWLGGSGGNKIVDGPRLKEVNGLAATEGAAIPRVYGRARLGGQLIWATRIEEEVTVAITRTKSGGKGGRSTKTYETTYSYYANLAIGLCEGPIAFIRRIWVDGREYDVQTAAMRLHRGDEVQAPDPLIVAKEAGEAPAYRGLAYVVFERFPLADYGNRVPQFDFEVVRAVEGLNRMIRAVALTPGAGEFVYDMRPVSHEPEPGVSESLTRHQLYGNSDADTALVHLLWLCPNLRRVSLVVSWFGDDLRAGACSVAPRAEIVQKPTEGADWSVAGLTRFTARIVSEVNGRPAFGGTPSDESVVALIRRLRFDYGLEVVLYPFLMMDIPAGNTLPDPWSGAASQPRYPWRGRITCDPAPGRPGSPEGGAGAAAQIASFVGTVGPADMTEVGGVVACAKPGEWSYRRLVMHCAALARLAGGVDGFVVGSEMVGLTHLRGASGYPMPDHLAAIAGDVATVLPGAVLTYAADWTEYGADVRNGGQDVDFPLDSVWASSAIGAIGIDFYPPLSDWRDSASHADAGMARGPADLAYLRERLTAGEAYDWYYADAAGRAAQARLPITDGAHGKPWTFRPKDLRGWWSNAHIRRAGGAETTATAFSPGGKPIWLTEIGVPAVDKGANAPNMFPDPKSAESGYPPFSSGARDDLVQARALEAIISGFDPARLGFEAARNPVHPVSGIRMVDPAHIFVWNWDLRPFPAFPDLSGIWADGANFDTGHWLNGRLEGTPVDRLVARLLADFGLPAASRITVDGFVDGYVLDRPLSARQALEPLAQSFGFDAIMSAGALRFEGRGGKVAHWLGADDLVPDRGGEPFTLRRGQESELPLELRLGFSDSEADYRSAAARSRRLAGAARREVAVETAIVTRSAEGQRLADQRLQEAWAARESLECELSPRCVAIEPGDVLSLPVDAGSRLFRVTRIAEGATRRISARAVEPAVYVGAGAGGNPRPPRNPPALPGRPLAVPLELPIVTVEPPPLLSLAAFAAPWPGALAIWRADEAGLFTVDGFVEAPSIVGETLTALPPGPLWRTDRGAVLEVRLRGGILASVPPEAALSGANALALIGEDGEVEIVTVAEAELVGPQRFRLSRLIRGIGGSEAAAGRLLPEGARVVVLDGAAVPLTTSLADLGRSRRYRVGPARHDVGDPTMVEFEAGVTGRALVPLSPVRPRARRGDAGIALSWLRRTRIDGDSWELTEVPLGEADERYEIRIFDGDTALHAEIVNGPGWTYPAAQEIVDFGAPQLEIALSLRQLSTTVGVGGEWRGRIPVR
ncbi:glycoside hydrolase/phage tail family protein [Bosea sp. (in: a-proteobacteria)]|uniref:baseplate multidomain protein megatron n=1 Tax=Bosea sp. (in: a-proteobacteria) TaxID=1871050 RepID=UPI00262915B6|nr:glycoside hydrolase/phage tail family protein [Bosea sp. (in: a-proteobacteria)]MCO5092557.1 glycoside hydrolase/phage tail family protein [Bosea sp. (in: a-proteobacteria)]